ncbi:MAG: hypothetical protein WAT39_03255 [Planctomycetota bacterium]
MMKVDFKPEARVLGQFAYLAVVGLPLIAWLVLRLCGAFEWTHPAMLAAAGVGVLQLVLFQLGIKQVTHAAFVVLMIVAMPIGFVISHVLIATIYYLVMTPIGLVFRLIGRDVIGKRPDPKAASYWHDKGQPRPATSYFKLY